LGEQARQVEARGTAEAGSRLAASLAGLALWMLRIAAGVALAAPVALLAWFLLL
jgi:hypothetical protein